MHVLLLRTGGTIGSLTKNGVRSVEKTPQDALLAGFTARYAHTVKFTTFTIFNRLSENILPSDWTKLFQSLGTFNIQNYDAVFITHGTDTLPYTAALAGYLLGGVGVPVFFIASNDPLESANSNAYSNMDIAVQCIPYFKQGVFVPWQSKDGRKGIHLATRLNMSNSYTHEFTSYNEKPFATLCSKGLVVDSDKSNPTLKQLEEHQIICKANNFTAKILKIVPYTGLNYDIIQWNEKNKPNAVLHELYHSATASTRGSSTSLEVFLERCNSEKIPVYGASFHKDKDFYTTTKQIVEKGIRPLVQIAPSTAYAKLHVAYADGGVNAEKIMKTNIYFEHIV